MKADYTTTLKDYSKETFKKVFDCQNINLASLKGSPIICKKDFLCGYNLLTSLKFGPKEVDGNFNCRCNLLRDLKFAPQIVKKDFDCSYNQLDSLEGCPEEVGGTFKCSRNLLTTLKDCPKKIGRKHIICNQMFNLTDISDIPTDINFIDLDECPNVEIFTKEITTEDGILEIACRDKIKEKVKQWKYYEVVEELYASIKVKITSIGHRVIDSI